jgi:VanZ family protein
MRQPSLFPSTEAMVVPPRSRWITVVLVAAAIFLVSVIPIPESVPDDGGGVPTSVLFHFIGYAVLAAVLCFALFTRWRPLSANAFSLLGASFYGVLIECVQYPIPYRSFSHLDMLINSVGALCGVLVFNLLLALSEQRGETAAENR